MHSSPKKQAEFETSLLKFLAVERLSAYKKWDDSIEDMLTRYCWNIKLCESLYAPLQNLEIVLRNSIHNACSAFFNISNWYSQSFFEDTQVDEINNAMNSLYDHGKNIEPSRIVSELSFGYWTSLFNATYEQTLFRTALINVFTNAPRFVRKRSILCKTLNDIRKLRNRVFHHEPIWNDNKLQDKHNSILEILYWMNKDMFCFTKSIDTFHYTYRNGTTLFNGCIADLFL